MVFKFELQFYNSKFYNSKTFKRFSTPKIFKKFLSAVVTSGPVAQNPVHLTLSYLEIKNRLLINWLISLELILQKSCLHQPKFLEPDKGP